MGNEDRKKSEKRKEKRRKKDKISPERLAAVTQKRERGRCGADVVAEKGNSPPLANFSLSENFLLAGKLSIKNTRFKPENPQPHFKEI